jgi:hypothetical protein
LNLERDGFLGHISFIVILFFVVGNAGYLLIQNSFQPFIVQIILGIVGGILE